MPRRDTAALPGPGPRGLRAARRSSPLLPQLLGPPGRHAAGEVLDRAQPAAPPRLRPLADVPTPVAVQGDDVGGLEPPPPLVEEGRRGHGNRPGHMPLLVGRRRAPVEAAAA